MRWIPCLAAASAALVLLLGCKSATERTGGPKTQTAANQPERTLTKMEPEQAKRVREQAETFLKSFEAQNFDAMWAMIADESKKEMGIANFVKANTYTGSGQILDYRVESVDGLGPGKALVKSVLQFQYAPSVFGTGEPEIDNMVWEDEWVQQADGGWYRKLPLADRDSEEWRAAEELCQNAGKTPGIPQ